MLFTTVEPILGLSDAMRPILVVVFVLGMFVIAALSIVLGRRRVVQNQAKNLSRDTGSSKGALKGSDSTFSADWIASVRDEVDETPKQSWADLIALQTGTDALPEPVYPEPAYVEPAYVEPVYVEPVYVEPAYVEPAYVEPAYVEPVPEPVYAEPAYVEPVPEPVYAEPAYVEPAYVEPVVMVPAPPQPDDIDAPVAPEFPTNFQQPATQPFVVDNYLDED